ncbi:MAG: hypothetical protein IJ848_00815 [Alphaproteobacteria bacterium]|nr:hypothetical protein [Alphaproteobacteria bacterium]
MSKIHFIAIACALVLVSSNINIVDATTVSQSPNNTKIVNNNSVSRATISSNTSTNTSMLQNPNISKRSKMISYSDNIRNRNVKLFNNKQLASRNTSPAINSAPQTPIRNIQQNNPVVLKKITTSNTSQTINNVPQNIKRIPQYNNPQVVQPQNIAYANNVRPIPNGGTQYNPKLNPQQVVQGNTAYVNNIPQVQNGNAQYNTQVIPNNLNKTPVKATVKNGSVHRKHSNKHYLQPTVSSQAKANNLNIIKKTKQ